MTRLRIHTQEHGKGVADPEHRKKPEWGTPPEWVTAELPTHSYTSGGIYPLVWHTTQCRETYSLDSDIRD